MTKQENNIEFSPLSDPIGFWKLELKELDYNDLIQNLYSIKKDYPSVSKSNKGGYQTSDDIHLFPQFFPLVQSINDIIIKFTSNPNSKIVNMWGNISSFSNFNALHSHSKETNHMSGVIYLKCPKNSGNIVFHHPLNLDFAISNTPKESQILLFPSLIPHSVEPNLSQEDRISIAFNFNK